MSKATVYRSVQAAAERVPRLKCEQFLEGYRTQTFGAEVTGVKCRGKWLPIGLTVDANSSHFLLRSLEKVRKEMNLLMLVYNFKLTPDPLRFVDYSAGKKMKVS